MSARVVAIEVEGRLVARKPASDHADAIRLEHEAGVLADARHPGVVELVALESTDGVALLTEFAGPHSLDTIGPLDVERAAGLVASLADTVADLHDVGVVHGRIDRSHVVVGSGGRPVLCGFGGGGRIGTTPPPGPPASQGFRDPVATDDAALTPQLDVYGLGAILRSLVVDEASEIEPIPDRRFALARLHGAWSGYQQRALLTLADRATDESPLRRPSARRLAAEIHDTVPSARLGDASDPFAALRPAPDDDVAPSRLTRFVSLAAIGAGFLLFLFGIAGLRDSGSVAAAGSTVTPTSPPLVTATTRVSKAAATSCPTPLQPVAIDVDGDGCPDPVSVGPDGIVVIGTKRYSTGQSGDRVAVGDWNCDGVATVASVRPSTGEVFVFDGWATAGSDVTASPALVVPGAVDVQARFDADGCSTIIVVHDDGTEQELPQ